jgi:hypothetical protein
MLASPGRIQFIQQGPRYMGTNRGVTQVRADLADRSSSQAAA